MSLPLPAVPNKTNKTNKTIEDAPSPTSRIAMALALAVWLGLTAGGVALLRGSPPPTAVPLHHLRVQRGPKLPPAPQAPAPVAAPIAQPHPVIAVPADAAVPAAICAPWLERWPALPRKLCEAAQLAPSGAVSVRQMPIAWRDVAPAQEVIAAQRVLVVGAIHGDELTAAALALHWVALAQQEGRPVHWRFIPVLNPDGLLARPATRTNAAGVDLNRNFPTPEWSRKAQDYWERRTRRDPRRWPGPAPLSEPESQFLHAQMAEFSPDLVVSIHAPYGVLDFDGPQTPPQKLGGLHLYQLGVFPGSLGNYGGLQQGIPVVTIELHHALRMPAQKEIAAMWQDLLAWMDKYLVVSDH